MGRKYLIIRFSSIGDILQCLSVPHAIHIKHPTSRIDWLVRGDNSFLLNTNPHITEVLSFDRELGLWDLIKFAFQLRTVKYTHVYDAHNNLRSHIVAWILMSTFLNFFVSDIYKIQRPQILRRSKNRWKRILLFKFRKNLFPKPFYSQYSYLEPISEWIGKPELPAAPQLYIPQETLDFVKRTIKFKGPFIALVPSAAWELKRWPVAHWEKLIQELPDQKFVILGGPMDFFCESLARLAPDRVQNLAGQLTLIESCAVVEVATVTVAGDTGLLHAADQVGNKAIALIGPSAFGYPSRPSTRVMEVKDLPCKPCSKDGSGRCVQQVYQKCMVEIRPETVAREVRGMLSAESE